MFRICDSSDRRVVAEYLKKVGLVPCQDGDPSLPDCRGSYTRVGLEDGRVIMEL